MYDHDYYAKMDELMKNTLVDCIKRDLLVLRALAWYLMMQPIRLCDYIRERIQIEREVRRETEIRFQNLKRNGHI